VTIAREALAKFKAPVWGGQITIYPLSRTYQTIPTNAIFS